MTLQEFLLQIVGSGGVPGVLAYPAANWLFALFKEQLGMDPSSRAKRWWALGISFALSLAALSLIQLLGYTEITPDLIFYACVTAFSTSQMLHAQIDLPATKEG